MVSLFTLLTCSLVVQGLEWDYYPAKYMELPVDDTKVIDKAVEELHSISSATDLDPCVSCKMRLQVGKFLDPKLIPLVYSKWCKQEGFDETKCQMNYGYPSLDFSSLGGDFAEMVHHMDPVGLDGDLFCYYHDLKCHVMPELPNLNLNQLWPIRPRLYDSPKHSGDTFNVLHLSDLNLQLDYQVTSESNCNQTVCCSSHSYNKVAPPKGYDYSSLYDPGYGLSFYQSSYESGHFMKGNFVDQYKDFKPIWLPSHEFGAYSCDSPELLINNTLQIIRDFHENHLNFEFGLFTGGITDNSDKIFTDKNQIIETQHKGFRDIHHYLNSFPMLPTFGVHDNFPLGQLPPDNIKTIDKFQWQYDFLADNWFEKGWIDYDASKQIRYNKIGYSLTTSRGLKVISLNSNVWNTQNLYAFIDTLNFDPFKIWQFLIDELIQSEINEQRVWIIAHLPPSKHSLPVPSKVFQKIIERFSPKVIAAIFFGYNLKDQFNLIYGGDGTNKDLGNLINYALIGPSVSPYKGNNPSWRYYSVDSESFDIINSFTYYTKLNHTFINEGAEPVWEYEYLARDAYDPEQLWPVERSLDMEFWHHVGEKIRDIPEINRKFNKFEYRGSLFDPYYYMDINSETCENETTIMGNDNYCKVTSFTVMNRKECMLTDDQDDYVEPETPQTYVPLLRPYQAPEYQLLYQPEKLEHTEEGNYDEIKLKEPFEGTEFQENENLKQKKQKHPKQKSIRDKIHKSHKELKAELKKRSL